MINFPDLSMERLRRWIPWLSLVTGIISALATDRRPERAWWVVAVCCISWVGLWVSMWAARWEMQRTAGPHPWAMQLVRWGGRITSQSGAQTALFFAIPFYVRASTWWWAHWTFVGLLIGAAIITLWDPWHNAVLDRPLLGALMHAFATFAGVNAVLPILGIANDRSLMLAAISTAFITPLTAYHGGHLTPTRERALAVILAMALPAAMGLSALRAAIPAAPMRLVSAAIGTHVANLDLVDPRERFEAVPEHLVCFTKIWAPRGLRDALFHVWRQNGHARDRVALVIRGGDDTGFRTWSDKHVRGMHPDGTWSCSVETAAGQVLGRADARIGEQAD